MIQRILDYGTALFRAWEVLDLGIYNKVVNKRKQFNLGEANITMMLDHLLQEVVELKEAAETKTPDEVREELADCVSISLHIAHYQGISPEELFNTVLKKLVFRFEYQKVLDEEKLGLLAIPAKDRGLEWYNRFTHISWCLTILDEQRKKGHWDVGTP